MKRYFYTFIILSAVVLVSCKSAQKLYEEGRYEEAVVKAAKELNKKPNNIKLQNTLQDAYQYAVEDHLTRIHILQEQPNELKWEKIHLEYQSLQRLYDAIRKYHSVYAIVNPINYQQQIIEAATEAGEIRYERGMELLHSNNKQDIRAAYYEFEKALVFLPNDREIRNLKNEALQKAMYNVAIVPIHENNNIRFSDYRNIYRHFDSELMRDVKNRNSNPFVQYYTTEELSYMNVPIDYVVEIDIKQVVIGAFRDNKKTKTVEQNVVVKETVYKPDSVIKEYAKVQARLITTNRTMQSNAQLSTTIKDLNNRIVWSDIYETKHNWETQFTSYTGNERALSNEDKKKLTIKEEKPPSSTDIISILTNVLQEEAEKGISRFFNRI